MWWSPWRRSVVAGWAGSLWPAPPSFSTSRPKSVILKSLVDGHWALTRPPRSYTAVLLEMRQFVGCHCFPHAPCLNLECKAFLTFTGHPPPPPPIPSISAKQRHTVVWINPRFRSSENDPAVMAQSLPEPPSAGLLWKSSVTFISNQLHVPSKRSTGFTA